MAKTRYLEAKTVLEKHFEGYECILYTNAGNKKLTTVIRTKRNPWRLAYLGLEYDGFSEISRKCVCVGYGRKSLRSYVLFGWRRMFEDHCKELKIS